MEILFSKEKEGVTFGKTPLKTSSLNFNVPLKILKTVFFQIISRFNLKATLREMKELGKKHGPYFLVYAVFIELVEDVVIPSVLYSVGKPHLIPAALAFHCEPVAYPLYFAVASLVKRQK